MKKKALDFIKKNGKYLFVYRKPKLEVEYEINSKELTVNGEIIKLDKPFENIKEFEIFCIETDLF